MGHRWGSIAFPWTVDRKNLFLFSNPAAICGILGPLALHVLLNCHIWCAGEWLEVFYKLSTSTFYEWYNNVFLNLHVRFLFQYVAHHNFYTSAELFTRLSHLSCHTAVQETCCTACFVCCCKWYTDWSGIGEECCISLYHYCACMYVRVCMCVLHAICASTNACSMCLWFTVIHNYVSST